MIRSLKTPGKTPGKTPVCLLATGTAAGIRFGNRSYHRRASETQAPESVTLSPVRPYRLRLSIDFYRSETGDKPDHPLFNREVLI